MSRLQNTISLFSILVVLVIGSSAQSPQMREINGGILNSKAKSLPSPEYSEEAKAADLGGTVKISILIDEDGNVVTAEHLAVEKETYVFSGAEDKNRIIETPVSDQEQVSPLLVDAARTAALAANFAPTFLNGNAVRVRGILVYRFMPKNSSQDNSTSISGGVLNGKAMSLPKPQYPPAALAVRASGSVNVQVVIDENGMVISAKAVSGHPLLRSSAVDAATGAVFAPILLRGEPVKVSGVLVYNFQLPDDIEQ